MLRRPFYCKTKNELRYWTVHATTRSQKQDQLNRKNKHRLQPSTGHCCHIGSNNALARWQKNNCQDHGLCYIVDQSRKQRATVRCTNQTNHHKIKIQGRRSRHNMQQVGGVRKKIPPASSFHLQIFSFPASTSAAVRLMAGFVGPRCTSKRCRRPR